MVPKAKQDTGKSGGKPDIIPEQKPTPSQELPPGQAERGIYAYIGPSVKGVVNNGRIFDGRRPDIIDGIKASAEAAGLSGLMPKISRLVVPDKDIITAKDRIAQGGNSMADAFKAVAEARKETK